MRPHARGKKPAVRAVLFDFGGVLAEEGFREGLKSLARRFGLDPEAFYELGSEAVYESGYVTGKGSEQDFWALMARRSSLPGYREDFTAEILRHFELRPAMLAAVRELRRRGYATVILSDQTDWLDRLEARGRFFQEFDRVFNSYHLGKGKRDPSLFDDVVRELRIAPEQALFIDDNSGNVERARARGLQALLFTGQAACLAALESLPLHPG